jgi:tetratricopeptide (TPR) repeat protein
MNYPHYQPKPHPKLNLPDFNLADTGCRLAAERALQNGNRHYNQYLARSNKKELEQAVQSFHQAVELDASLTEAQVKLASALYDQGKITAEEAIRRCELAAELNPNCAETALFLGYFLRRTGQLEQAESAFQRAVCLKGKTKARARMALGGVLIQQAAQNERQPSAFRLSKTLQGLIQFTWGLCSLPSDRQAFRVAIDALALDAQIIAFTTAGRLLKSCRLTEASIRLYTHASRILPQEPIFFHLLGDLQAEKGNASASVYFYNRCQELDADDLALYKKLGQAYNRCNDSENAAKSLEKVVEANAQDADTLYTLAQIYTDSQEYMRALYYYKALLAENPDNPYLHSHIGFILFKMEDYDGAIEEYQAAIQLGQDAAWTSTVAQTLGTIYHQIRQDNESALQLFQLATQLDPANLDAWAMLGDIHTEQNNYEEAIEIYRRILKAQPDNADCYNYLGYLLWQLDKNDEAIKAYQQAIALNVDNPVAFNNLGVIYLDEKCLPEKALAMFQQAVELKPDYTLARFNIARSREALGQIAEAAQCYSDALKLNAQNPELTNEEILDRLDQLFQV